MTHEAVSLTASCRDIVYDLMTAVESTRNSSNRGVHEHGQSDRVVPVHEIRSTTLRYARQISANAQSTYVDGAQQQQPRVVASPLDYSQENFSYAPPPRADGSGRLPNGFWQDLPAHQEIGTQAQLGSPPPLNSAHTPNPDLEAIFADLLPTLSHEDPFTAMVRCIPQYLSSGQLFEGVGPAGARGPEGQPYIQPGEFADARFVDAGMPSVWGARTQDGSL